MPAVSFISFIPSLNTTALFHLGDLPHPETGQKVVDLELARHSIDTLVMLEEKTKGNLEKDEQELMDNPRLVATDTGLCVDVAGWYWSRSMARPYSI